MIISKEYTSRRNNKRQKRKQSKNKGNETHIKKKNKNELKRKRKRQKRKNEKEKRKNNSTPNMSEHVAVPEMLSDTINFQRLIGYRGGNLGSTEWLIGPQVLACCRKEPLAGDLRVLKSVVRFSCFVLRILFPLLFLLFRLLR